MDKHERKETVKNVEREQMESMLTDVKLYPQAKDVLEDEELECVFKPFLSVKKIIKEKEYLIHVLLSLGVKSGQLLKNYLYSENGFFGFAYNGGKYKYLGSKEVFCDYEKTVGLNRYLQADFIEQKEVYLANKISMEVYIEGMMKKIKSMVSVGNCESLTNYLKSFYSYELTKFQYQATGILKSFREITDGWQTSKNFIFNEKEITNIIDEFFINIKYNLDNSYDITPDMTCFGMEAYNFMQNKCMLFALVDAERDRVYMLDY